MVPLNYMKRTAAKILCIVCLFVVNQGYLTGQDRPFRIGFQASPVFSGMRNKDDLIVKTGGNLGLKLGAISDIYLKNNLSVTLGINLAFHEGGEFQYEVGGNFLPDSELNDPLLQTGDKPLPDGVKIRYQVHYLEFPVGLKFRTEAKENMTWFFEAPVLTFSFLTRARGDIETADYFYEKENIRKDIGFANIFLGLGAGVEYAISQNNSLIGGLYFQRGLFDVTSDKGYFAFPNPDIIPTYFKVDEDSRASIGNLILCLGILF